MYGDRARMPSGTAGFQPASYFMGRIVVSQSSPLQAERLSSSLAQQS